VNAISITVGDLCGSCSSHGHLAVLATSKKDDAWPGGGAWIDLRRDKTMGIDAYGVWRIGSSLRS
jgi:hypothetical protein